MSKNTLAIISIIAITLLLVLPIRVFQPSVVGRDIALPCGGVIALSGYKKIRYSQVSYSEFESLAHYETVCFFGINLGDWE